MRRRAAYSIFIALVVSPLLLIGCGNSENKNGTGGSGGGTGVAGGTTKLDGGGTEGGMGGAKIDGGAVDAGGVTGTGCGADTISNVDLTSSYTGAWATSTTADGKLAGGPLIAAAPTNGSTGTGITFANWNGNFVQVTQGNTTTITFTPIALSSDTVVNTLLSNFYGGSNTQAVITFTNSNNATAVYSLVGGQTIRDYNNNTFQNGLSLTGSNSTPGLGSVTAQEWWNDGHSGMYQRLDVQTFVLPSSWNGSHLNSITIANPSDSSGSDVLSALQVRSPACAKLDAGGAPDVAPSPVDTVDAGAAGVGETSDSRVADAPIGQDAPIALDGDSGVDSAASLPTPAPDYVWYVLDETQGTTAKDSSSHHYDIANLAGVTWSEGANFDGLSGGGSVAVDSSYRTPPITISAWLTPRARADKTANSYVFQPYPTNAFGDDLPGNSGYGLGLNVWTDARRRARGGGRGPLRLHRVAEHAVVHRRPERWRCGGRLRGWKGVLHCRGHRRPWDRRRIERGPRVRQRCAIHRVHSQRHLGWQHNPLARPTQRRHSLRDQARVFGEDPRRARLQARDRRRPDRCALRRGPDDGRTLKTESGAIRSSSLLEIPDR